MGLGLARKILYLVCALVGLAFPCLAAASEYHGQVTFAGSPLPGATVTATQGTKKITAVTDQGGLYNFPDLADGPWKIDIEMLCFAPDHADVTVSPATPPGKWELTLLPLDQITKLTKLPPAPIPVLNTAPAPKKPANEQAADIPRPAEDQQSSDGFLVNGSTNNAATSRFSLDQAFGNRRSNSRSLYNGGFAAIYDNSALDARPYSLSGLESPKASYDRITSVFNLGGPLNIPHLMPRGPTFYVAYLWTRNHDAESESGLVPTGPERTGNLFGLLDAAGQPVTVYNPMTGLPFPGNVVPVSAQAQSLLQLYPLSNIPATTLYNYQVPVLNSTHQDSLLTRLDKTISRRDEVYGAFNLQSTRASTGSLFGFTDKTDTLGINTNINWSHRFNQRLFLYATYRFSRQRIHITPYFENRQNISGNAGISGNNQDPTYWGPPALTFSSGITPLIDQQSSFNRNRTDGFSGSVGMYRGRHNVTLGGDFRKQQYNDLFQEDPRGTFTFTGAATQSAASASSGSDLADFLIGVPDTSSIAFGNADKYLRQNVFDAYAADDWRVESNLTLNLGLRWEYGAPMTEIHGRLVNLDVAPGFTDVAQVTASDPVGPITHQHYPSSLIRPDRLGIEPRIGLSWRPIPASTVVVRAGYGIYDDTSVYQTAVLQLAQQPPISKTQSVQNSALCPLTLADAFGPCAAITANTFAVDPNFRVGYAQTWQLSVQRDMPGALQLTATYLGVKGTRGVQQFLPNTYPIGAANPCTTCLAGFVYQTSGGDSTREAGQVQLRRRLRNGFTASLLYTYSKSIDDDAMLGGQGHVVATSQAAPSSGQGQGSSQGAGGSAASTASTTQSGSATAAIAQNWLNLHAERGLSNFDQRHLLNLTAQYTSGEGLGGGTLMSGWPGRLLKEWTFVGTSVIGTGLPETPVYLAAVPGTGFTGTIRPNPSGAKISISNGNQHLNPAAYTAPVAGQWGTAGRNSITGPTQASLDTSINRTFRPTPRFFLDFKVAATNMLNHPVFSSWNTTVNSTQFGVPLAPNAMRSLETSLRLRF
jgi:hypothetical protein